MLFPPLAKDAEPIPCGAAQWSPDSRRVLLADDDEAVRLIAARVLQLLKFEVTVAVDGEDALRVFESSPVPFRAVMLDIAMPNLDGISAAQEIRKICPTQPILFRLPAGLTAGVIQKPFSAAGIRTTLEQCVVNQVN
jgi:CheY-like chemotaxis protein